MAIILDPYTHLTVRKGDLINIENYEELKTNIENILSGFNTYDYKAPDDPEKSKHVKAIGTEQHALATDDSAGFVDPSWMYKDITNPTGESLQEYNDEIEYLYNRIQYDIFPELSIAIWNGSRDDELPHGWYFCDGSTVTLENGEKFKTPDLRCCIPVAATLDREFLSIHTEFEVEDAYEPVPPPANYITFKSSDPFKLASYSGTSGTTVAKYWNGTIKYSTDTVSWIEWDGSLINSGTATNSDNVIYLAGFGNTHINKGSSEFATFYIEGSNVECIGNIESLLDCDKVKVGVHPTMDSNCYYRMFQHCTSLITAPELTAMTLTNSCYESMFDGCTSLITPPDLPATILANACYGSMFKGCTSLETAPELSATILKNACYNGMFYGCTSLITPPDLPATILDVGCYMDMFYNCTSLNTLPLLPATTLASYCYERMFKGCTSIKLSATQTGEYQKPYRIPSEGTGIVADSWNASMFSGTGGTFKGDPELNRNYFVPGSWYDLSTTKKGLNYLVYGNNIYCGLDSYGSLVYSYDLITWGYPYLTKLEDFSSYHSSKSVSETIYSLVFDEINKYFIASVPNEAYRILISKDGIHWYYKDGSYVNGTMITTLYNNTPIICGSTNIGFGWEYGCTAVTLDVSFDDYTPIKFNQILHRNTNIGGYPSGCYYEDRDTICFANFNTIYTSKDNGNSWSSYYASGVYYLRCCGYNGTYFLTMGNSSSYGSNYCFRSKDFINWEKCTIPFSLSSTINKNSLFVYNNKFYFINNNSLYSSDDGSTWTVCSNVGEENYDYISYLKNIYVAYSNSPVILRGSYNPFN